MNPVSTAQRARYSPIIDSILQASNLDEISAKRIRTSLQTAVNEDFSENKVTCLFVSEASDY